MIAPQQHPQRTIYFSKLIDKVDQPLVFVARYEFTTCAYCPRLEESRAGAVDPTDKRLQELTSERPPHILFTPRVREIVGEVVGGETNPLVRARNLFHWVCRNVAYCAEMEYSTIDNLSSKAFTSGKGDCGVQAMAFITLCRAAGVPARWQSGWETLPRQENMHDWAEFYVEPWGWLPADPSYGLLDHDNPQVHEFYFGHLDAYRMIVNTDYARPLFPAKTSFRSEPNDFQRGEVEIDGHNLYFDEWDWEFTVHTTPLADTK